MQLHVIRGTQYTTIHYCRYLLFLAFHLPRVHETLSENTLTPKPSHLNIKNQLLLNKNRYSRTRIEETRTKEKFGYKKRFHSSAFMQDKLSTLI